MIIIFYFMKFLFKRETAIFMCNFRYFQLFALKTAEFTLYVLSNRLFPIILCSYVVVRYNMFWYQINVVSLKNCSSQRIIFNFSYFRTIDLGNNTIYSSCNMPATFRKIGVKYLYNLSDITLLDF